MLLMAVDSSACDGAIASLRKFLGDRVSTAASVREEHGKDASYVFLSQQEPLFRAIAAGIQSRYPWVDFNYLIVIHDRNRQSDSFLQDGRSGGAKNRVRVQAIAVSRNDLLWRQGSYFEEPVLPARIGYEAAGIVESVGPGVKTLFPKVHQSPWQFSGF